VAFGQAVVKQAGERKTRQASPLRVVEGIHNLGIQGEDFRILFNHVNASIISYNYGGVEMIGSDLRPNFWRAITDNDRGCQQATRSAQWKIASLYATNGVAVGASPAEHPHPIVDEENKTVTISYTYHLPTSPAATCDMTYTVHADGVVDCTLSYDPVEGLGEMPVFGTMFKMSADFDHLEWYGNGPEENYVDRNRGAKLGVYRNKVMDNYTPYLRPQECGNKTEVRWAKVTDDRGRGLMFFGEPFEFSALPWTPHELDNAEHSYELPPVHFTVIRCSKQQMGVGGDDSWGALVHPEYLIDVSGKVEFTFTFRGI
jgi:beta-galactosidase